jgi:hypothetical protein
MTPLEAAGRALDRAAEILRWYRGMGYRNEVGEVLLEERFVACLDAYAKALRQECGRLGLRE